jgi:Lon protease-like protein
MLLLLSAASAWHHVPSAHHVPPRATMWHPRRASDTVMVGGGAAGTAAGGGGDLSGGGDDERNAQVAALRKMFNQPTPEDVPDEESAGASGREAADARKFGLLMDLPLCRYSWCLLPGHQIAMSVWQPQYTLMFNTLLAEPGPHYYLHVLLPGGAESLGEEGYELAPGSKSSLMGTLVRVALAQRNPDSTLTLVVQGLTRGVVLSPTQLLPYSRGNVQVLPDSETLLAAALASERLLQRTAQVATTSRVARRKLVAAAAWAEVETYVSYEALQISIDAGGSLAPLNQFNATAAADTFASVSERVDTALQEVDTALREPLAPSAATEMPEATSEDPLYEGSVALRLLDSAVEAAEDAVAAEVETSGKDAAEVETSGKDAAEIETSGKDAAAAEAEAAEALHRLEIQVWLELDAMLQAIRESRAASTIEYCIHILQALVLSTNHVSNLVFAQARSCRSQVGCPRDRQRCPSLPSFWACCRHRPRLDGRASSSCSASRLASESSTSARTRRTPT